MLQAITTKQFDMKCVELECACVQRGQKQQATDEGKVTEVSDNESERSVAGSLSDRTL